jgi:hypothetical protein
LTNVQAGFRTGGGDTCDRGDDGDDGDDDDGEDGDVDANNEDMADGFGSPRVSRASSNESRTTASLTSISATPTGNSTTPSQTKELGFVLLTSLDAFLAGNV